MNHSIAKKRLGVYVPKQVSSWTGVLFLLLAAGNADAYAGNWGSGYSRFGIGDLRYFAHERSAGLGGTHIALLATNAVSSMNPAAWTRLNRMRFSISTAYEGYTVQDGSNSTFLSGASFNGFSLAIPMSVENGFVVSAGLTPYSVVNYNVVSEVTEPSFSYTLKNVGEGGLSSAHIGTSMLLGRHWHLGIKFNYFFGSLHHTTDQLFSSTGNTDATVRRSTRLNGASLSLGAIYSDLGSLVHLPESDVLTVGVLFNSASNLSTSRQNTYEYRSAGSIIGRDSVLIAEGTSTLPFAFGLGLSYTTKEKFMLASDFYYQNWKRFDLLGGRPGELRDSYRLSIGAEMLPRRDIAAKYFEKVSYQIGAFYNATHLRIRGTAINEVGVTAGAGLPIFGETRLTVGVQYSIRGTIDIEKDNILRVSLTLNAGEFWFIRPPED